MRILFDLHIRRWADFCIELWLAAKTDAEGDQIDGTTDGQERIDGMYLCSK